MPKELDPQTRARLHEIGLAVDLYRIFREHGEMTHERARENVLSQFKRDALQAKKEIG